MAEPATPTVSVNNPLGGEIFIAFTGMDHLDFGDVYSYIVTATTNPNWSLARFDAYYIPSSIYPSSDIKQPLRLSAEQGRYVNVGSIVAKPGIGLRDCICVHVKAIFTTDDKELKSVRVESSVFPQEARNEGASASVDDLPVSVKYGYGGEGVVFKIKATEPPSGWMFLQWEEYDVAREKWRKLLFLNKSLTQDILYYIPWPWDDDKEVMIRASYCRNEILYDPQNGGKILHGKSGTVLHDG